MEKSQLLDTYQSEMDACYIEIVNELKSRGLQCSVRQETTVMKDINMYFIEIFAPDPPDSDDYDDYGVVVDVSLRDGSDCIICEVLILRAFGAIYNEQTFEIKSETDINNSLGYIRSLSPIAVKHFVQDYIKL